MHIYAHQGELPTRPRDVVDEFPPPFLVIRPQGEGRAQGQLVGARRPPRRRWLSLHEADRVRAARPAGPPDAAGHAPATAARVPRPCQVGESVHMTTTQLHHLVPVGLCWRGRRLWDAGRR